MSRKERKAAEVRAGGGQRGGRVGAEGVGGRREGGRGGGGGLGVGRGGVLLTPTLSQHPTLKRQEAERERMEEMAFLARQKAEVEAEAAAEAARQEEEAKAAAAAAAERATHENAEQHLREAR